MLELAAVDAQVRALEVIDRKPGVRVQLLGDGVPARGFERVARAERERVLAHRELLDLGQQRLRSRRRVRQLLVIPRGRRIGRQRELVRKIDAGIDLRKIDQHAEIEYLRQQHDAVEIDRAIVLQDIGKDCRARRAVAFAEQIFR